MQAQADATSVAPFHVIKRQDKPAVQSISIIPTEIQLLGPAARSDFDTIKVPLPLQL